MSESELRAEVAHHERVRAAMAAMHHTTAELIDTFEVAFEEGKQNRFEGDKGPDKNLGFAMANYGADRMADLSARDIALFFGRLWFDTEETYHIGRRHVRDDSSVPLVLDWRAPICEHYYRASAHDRRGVAKRRRFGFRGARLTGFEDEDLRLGAEVVSDILTAEIERPRTGPMRDIVATIQPEQDELIRRDADTSLCVQGAPGTGKTAVGLHRAAWLLYNYPGRLQQSGLLVIGPNEGFLSYIAGVLPTLGESSVRQVTVDQLTGGATATATDTRAAAMVKHDARMARVCERAVWSHIGRIADAGVSDDEGLVIADGGWRWRLGAKFLDDAIAGVRERTQTWETGRKTLEDALVQGARRQAELRAGMSPDSRWVTRLKRQPAVKDFLDAVWPKLNAKAVLRKLYLDADFRETAADGILSPEEAELLATKSKTIKHTAADLLVLDEIGAHLKLAQPSDSFGHIIIDEAQDLSAMQCRAVARKSGNGSLTILGDLAQGTTAWAAADWPTQLRHLGKADAEHLDLTTGFRVPGVIIELANRMLPHLGVDVAAARSLRSDGSLDHIRADDLVETVSEVVDKALAEEGLIGVIAADEHIDDLRAGLPASDRVEAVPASLAKGLEFDHVVVAEPATIVRAPATGGSVVEGVGLRHLYVALTRAVSGLSIVHTQPLPAELGV